MLPVITSLMETECASEPCCGGSGRLGKHIGSKVKCWNDILTLRILYQMRVEIEPGNVVVVDIKKWFLKSIDLKGGKG